MYHSITFGDKNTWDDWHLVPASRPVFNPPAVKTRYVDIPGADGSIDLTDALTGYPVYENREGTVEFIVVNDYGQWQDRYSEIMGYLHGRSMRAILEDDPGYYYEGRFAVDEWASEENWSRITIAYNLAPYKHSVGEDQGPAEFQNIPVSTTPVTRTYAGSDHSASPECPVFAVSSVGTITDSSGNDILDSSGSTIDSEAGTVYVTCVLGDNQTTHLAVLTEGTNQVPEIVFQGESVSLTLYLLSDYPDDVTVSVYFSHGRL